MVTRAKKTEYWILNTFPYNRVSLCNMLIYMAKHSFRHCKNIEMRPIKNRVCFLTKFQIVSVLPKIAPYHMLKFGSCWKSLLITCQNLVDAENLRTFAPTIERTAYCAENRSSMKTGAGLKWWQAPVIYEGPKSGQKNGGFRVVAISKNF